MIVTALAAAAQQIGRPRGCRSHVIKSSPDIAVGRHDCFARKPDPVVDKAPVIVVVAQGHDLSILLPYDDVLVPGRIIHQSLQSERRARRAQFQQASLACAFFNVIH
eukprot:9365785-Prorocentrum_lima.AAC.1